MTMECENVIYSCGIVSVFPLHRSPDEKAFLTSPIQAEQSRALIIQKRLALSPEIRWSSMQNLLKEIVLETPPKRSSRWIK